MMKVFTLPQHYGEPIELPVLTDGMVVAMVMDDGPTGICGQSMSITCPWQYLHFFPDESAFREYVKHKKLGRGGKGNKWAYCVVGENGTGTMNIIIH